MGATRADELKRKLQLAFSEREKARRLAQECRKEYAGGSIDEERYNALRRFYESRLKAATERMGELRDAADRALKQAHEALQQVREDRNKLSALVTEGAIPAEQANAQSRKQAARIALLKKELGVLRETVAAESAKDLGGFVDRPLEDYEGRPGTLERLRPSRTAVVAFVIPLLTSLSVCLPWLVVGGRRISLLAAGTVLGAGLGGFGMQGLVAHVWVAYVTLPLTAIPFWGTRGYRKSGLAMLLIGAAIVAGSVLPAFVLREGATQSLGRTHHIAMSFIGPVGYAVGAILLLVAGLRRLFGRSSPRASWWRGAIGLGAAALAMMVALVAALASITAEEGTVAFDARLAARGTVAQATCRNRTMEPVTLWVPTPEGGTPGNAYSVSVHVLEDDGGRYRLFPTSGPYWTCEGVAVGDALEVGPGSFKTVACDLGRLKGELPSAESVRLVFSQGSRELERFEAELPSRSSGKSGGEFRRVRPQPNVLPRPAPADRPEAPEARGASAVEEPGLAVRFTGLMGGKAAVRVAEEGEERERALFVEAGDSLGAGWLLVEIDEAGGALLVRHDATQREVRVPRGATAVVVRP